MKLPSPNPLFTFWKAKLCVLALFAVFLSCNKQAPVDNTLPEENRFSTTVLTQPGEMDEPMMIMPLSDGRILFIERKGALKSWDPTSKEVKTLAIIPVNTKYTSKEGKVTEAEEGLMGLVVHPKFAENHFIYMYYADPVDKKHVLARWELRGDSLYASTKKVMLEIPTQREVCCHTGGGMTFDPDGNLYLTVGNNTGNPVSGMSDLDEREGKSSWDDQRTAGNTNDLRGKILKIHPEDDGTYTIPAGNLFPKGTEKTKPEIYTMGHRNPWRISYDTKTGYIYWGEVGPDASKDTTLGPRGYDEFNQAKKAGFFGWPYFIGNNIPYAHVEFGTDKVGETFDPQHPVNNSPNNTGLKELPLPEKAFIWYPYATSEEFPLVGSSGRSATGGPVFRAADFKDAKHPFPSYYEGKLLITEFMRGWIMSVTMDENGNFKSMEKFLPKENFSSAIDMKFGPDGALYVLEYGSAWFRGNDNAQLVKIEYNSGNRKPVVVATADKAAGAIPLTVNFSSAGTMDYDADDKTLKSEWTIKSDKGFSKVLTEASPSYTFDQAGIYTVSFVATDSKGESSSKSLEIKAGNEAPVVNIDILKGNKTFFFAKEPIEYQIDVTDKEDGSLADKKILPNEVAVNFDYVPEGFDPIEIAASRTGSDEWAKFSTGLNLMNKSDCKSCHLMDKKSVGPAYLDIAKKYKNNPVEQERIAGKIITGGAGVWGDHAMSAHPGISPQNAQTIVSYIISLDEKKATEAPIAMKGTYIPVVPEGDNGHGGFLLRVAYKDKGTKDLSSLTTEKIIALRNPSVDPEKYDESNGTQLMTTPSRSFSMVGDSSFLGYKSIDLTGIKQIEFSLTAQPRSGAVGGLIEVHLDSPGGKLIGKTPVVIPKDIDFRKIMAAMAANAPKPAPLKPGAKPASAPRMDFGLLRKLFAVHVDAELEAVQGQHDIYFVFKNPTAKPNQIIMQMIDIHFDDSMPVTKK